MLTALTSTFVLAACREASAPSAVATATQETTTATAACCATDMAALPGEPTAPAIHAAHAARPEEPAPPPPVEGLYRWLLDPPRESHWIRLERSGGGYRGLYAGNEEIEGDVVFFRNALEQLVVEPDLQIRFRVGERELFRDPLPMDPPDAKASQRRKKKKLESVGSDLQALTFTGTITPAGLSLRCEGDGCRQPSLVFERAVRIGN